MDQFEFEIVVKHLLEESKMDAIVFINKSCKLTLYITKLILLRKTEGNIGRAVYEALPILNKKHLSDFKDFNLSINISFNYGT